jgi:hypothetical protein
LTNKIGQIFYPKKIIRNKRIFKRQKCKIIESYTFKSDFDKIVNKINLLRAFKDKKIHLIKIKEKMNAKKNKKIFNYKCSNN